MTESFRRTKSSKVLRNNNVGQRQQHDDDDDIPVFDNSSGLKHGPNPDISMEESVNKLLQQVTFNLSSKSKDERVELRTKLQAELDLVRNLVNKIDEKEKEPNKSAFAAAGLNSGMAKKRPHVQQLSVSVVDNNNNINSQLTPKTLEREKEKRTPKANKYYQNSEFILAKDKFPPSESNKKTKPHGKKQGLSNSSRNEVVSNKTELSNKALKNCGALLERIMKHKHGWVFNTPVDPVSLGLRDYLEIIKHPMDLGTVKSRLDTNWYKSPKELAEDVRLTFNNAMTYNPKGQDVHVMAELLLKMFEEKYVSIESEYTQESRMAVKTHEVPKPRKGGATSNEKSDSSSKGFGVLHNILSGRTPAPKKPKAREPNKREMTYVEKQNLSSSLQNMPSDKLEDVVKIIKKRNSSLCQSDDEIEIDIDSVDTETLWELDRFVTNFRKMLSKNKRKAELAIQARPEEGSEDRSGVQEEIIASIIVEKQKEDRPDENNISSPAPVEQQGDYANKSSSRSSSNGAGGSGSSASGSDSESSLGDGHDAGNLPKKQK